MGVPGDCGVADGVSLGVVAECELSESRAGLFLVDAPLGGEIACVAVVVAGDEGHLEVGAVGAPPCDGVDGAWGEALAVVDEVAEYDEVCGFCLFERARECVEVAVGGVLWDGDAGCAEGGGFAEVDIGDEECGELGGEGGA